MRPEESVFVKLHLSHSFNTRIAGRSTVLEREISLGSSMSVFTEDARLAYRRSVEFYALTATPIFLISGLFGYLFLIYATDTLVLAPAAVGTLLAVSKIYDGVSDLLLGNWSDRTKGRFGRRRPYMIAGSLLFISFIGIWLPPENMGATATLLFIGVMLLVWETASTLLAVPFNALGIETGQTPQRRTALAVMGSVIGLPATVGAILLMQHIVDAEDARAAGTPWFICLTLAGIAVFLIGSMRIKELPVRHRTAERNVFRMLREVLGVHYHNRLLAVQAIETFAFTSMAFMVPYVMTYIIGEPGRMMFIFIAYLACTRISQIGWLMLVPRIGMKRIWIAGLIIWIAVFLSFPLVFLFGFTAYIAMAIVGGIASGAAIVNYAMLGDIADYDARQSGRQRQGVYITIYRLIGKIAGAAVAFILGWALQLTGFVPNAEQGTGTITAIALCTSLIPVLALIPGIMLLRGYDFYEREGISDGRRDFVESGTLGDTNGVPATA